MDAASPLLVPIAIDAIAGPQMALLAEAANPNAAANGINVRWWGPSLWSANPRPALQTGPPQAAWNGQRIHKAPAQLSSWLGQFLVVEYPQRKMAH
jgi:hypothetical protein